MTALFKRALVLVVLASLAACARGPSAGATMRAHQEDTVGGEVDGQWFTRDLWERGRLVGVELVYCPIMPDQPLVCRTTVVWRPNHSELVP